MEQIAETLTESSLLARVASVGLAEMGLYTVLAAMGDRRLMIGELAATLGVSSKTTSRYLSKLSASGLIRLDNQSVIFTDRTILRSLNISFNLLSLKDIKDINDATNVPTVKKTDIGLMAYWCGLYEKRYAVKYRASNWAREQHSLKLLDAKYGERLRPIIEVVMRLYETRWYSQRYPRPTIGALVSWLAAQADGYVTTDSPVVAAEPTEISLDDFDAKFGLGGATNGT